MSVCVCLCVNSSLFVQNGRPFADDIFKCILMNENVCILIHISLKFVPKGSIDDKPALVQIMAWCRAGNKPLPEPMFPQFTDAYMRHWGGVNSLWPGDAIWRLRPGSTLVQVMACCRTAPSHYLNQCWLIINKVKWHSSDSNFTRDNSAINHWNSFENHSSKISFKSPRLGHN